MSEIRTDSVKSYYYVENKCNNCLCDNCALNHVFRTGDCFDCHDCDNGNNHCEECSMYEKTND